MMYIFLKNFLFSCVADMIEDWEIDEAEMTRSLWRQQYIINISEIIKYIVGYIYFIHIIIFISVDRAQHIFEHFLNTHPFQTVVVTEVLLFLMRFIIKALIKLISDFISNWFIAAENFFDNNLIYLKNIQKDQSFIFLIWSVLFDKNTYFWNKTMLRKIRMLYN